MTSDDLSSNYPLATLEIRSHGFARSSFLIDRFDSTTVIGRDHSVDVYVHDLEVSRIHAEIKVDQQGNFRLVDLDSSNGTFVNGKRIKHCQLKDQSVIRVGKSSLLFRRQLLIDREGSTDNSDVDLLDDVDSGRVVESVQAAQLKRSVSSGVKPALNIAGLLNLLDSTCGSSDLNLLLKKILEVVFSNTAAHRACILLTKENGELERSFSQVHNRLGRDESRIQISKTILRKVSQTQRGVLIEDVSTDRKLSESINITHFKVVQAICVPILAKASLRGYIYLDVCANESAWKQVGELDSEDLQLVLVIGYYAAMAIENIDFQSALAEAERLSAIGLVAAKLAHHVKNYLQGLNNGSWLIESGLEVQNLNSVNEGWQIVQKHQQRIGRLLENMLSISSEHRHSFVPENIVGIIDEAVELVRHQAQQAGVRIEWSPPATGLVIDCDRSELTHAVTNVISNAIDACSNKEVDDLKVSIGMQVDRQQRQLRISIIDTGMGIIDEIKPQIFNLFVHKKSQAGFGLGLPVSQQILRAHGGEIKLVSSSEAGTHFQLILPLSTQLTNDPVTKNHPRS